MYTLERRMMRIRFAIDRTTGHIEVGAGTKLDYEDEDHLHGHGQG